MCDGKHRKTEDGVCMMYMLWKHARLPTQGQSEIGGSYSVKIHGLST